jgi:hypothetical protein
MSAPVALPSLPLALAAAGIASGAAAAAPVVVILDGAAEALAALAAAAQIAGTVTATENPGELVLLTALGALSLETPPALPVGTRLVIAAIPGRPDAAVVLAIDDVPTTARAVATAPATAAVPAPPTVLELGTTVTATILAAADSPPADLPAIGTSPEAAANPASATPAVSPAALDRPAPPVAAAAATIIPSPVTGAKPDIAEIVVAPGRPAGASASRAIAASPDPAPSAAASSSATPGNAAARAPGTVVTLRILAVQPATESGSPIVPALRGVVQPSPQRQAGTPPGALIDTPAGVLKVLATPEPVAGRPVPAMPPPGTPVALRLLAGAPPTALLTVAAPDAPAGAAATAGPPTDAQGAAAPGAAPAKPAPADPVSYRVLFGASDIPQPAGSPPGEAPTTLRPVIGTIVTGPSAAGATVIATPFGMLAVKEPLALPPGTLLLLAPQDDPPVANGAPAAPTRFDRSWSALEAALTTLGQAAPELAAHLRADLSLQSGERLAAGLTVLVAALRDGTTRNWTGDAIARALGAAGRDDLTLRLGDEFAALRGLADNPATAPWQVFLLPLVDGPIVRPIRLYLKRRGERGRRAASEDNARFILEFELTRLGTMQLDGFVRPRRFDLVLRSHAALAAPLRRAVERIFYDRAAAAGLAGTIDFAVAARFEVAPLDGLRAKIGLAV